MDGLTDSGVNTERLLKQSGLNKFNLDNIENYIPVDAMLHFLNEACKKEGISTLADQFSSNIDLRC